MKMQKHKVHALNSFPTGRVKTKEILKLLFESAAGSAAWDMFPVATAHTAGVGTRYVSFYCAITLCTKDILTE
jgi:hypothetical protein